ncbi:sulfotransferase [Paraburkholderia sp. 31.1]|uniref:sulfotransferase n=1 Tax=Paraburkholderia sp. 31.1 TaxID=2615205 RepID=UPI001654FC95|nr:sulfotransferase [Paraburkholderia sp. 31.1]MBC8725509.1 sulfotransferase [Paraburkholderia sp. 31.1]
MRDNEAESLGALARFADKYPFNFINVGLIHLALPNARINHGRRSPLHSVYRFSRAFLRRGVRLPPRRAGPLSARVRCVDNALAARSTRGRDDRDRDEELVDACEANVRRMLAHCGLE